jgi:tetratricopeptide (TPR) repeat protein
MTKKQARPPATKTNTPPIPGLEDALRELEKLTAAGGLITQDDLDALLKSLQGPTPEDGLSDEEADKRIEAQQLAFDAQEASTEAQALKLAKRALSLHPDCVDALVVRAEIECHSTRKLIEAMQSAVAAGERSLGATFIRENTGNFWGLLDTRPYMRALERLAGLLAAEGLNLDAIRIYEKMLLLNPNDNQGVRDPLLGVYLSIGDLKGAARLLKKFEEDSLANFAWGRVLERFLAGDSAGARHALIKARQANRFVELHLTAQRPIPETDPEMYSMGSEDEAVLCMNWVGRAWSTHKEAVFWLMDQQAAKRQPAILSKAALKRVPTAGKRVQ